MPKKPQPSGYQISVDRVIEPVQITADRKITVLVMAGRAHLQLEFEPPAALRLADGIMAAFISAADAVRFACQVHEALRQHNEPGPEFPVMVRIGISAGEPVAQGNDLFGSTVQLAARLCAQAEPGQVLVSSMVAELCDGESLKFSETREVQLKGFEREVAACAVELSC